MLLLKKFKTNDKNVWMNTYYQMYCLKPDYKFSPFGWFLKICIEERPIPGSCGIAGSRLVLGKDFLLECNYNRNCKFYKKDRIHPKDLKELLIERRSSGWDVIHTDECYDDFIADIEENRRVFNEERTKIKNELYQQDYTLGYNSDEINTVANYLAAQKMYNNKQHYWGGIDENTKQDTKHNAKATRQ